MAKPKLRAWEKEEVIGRIKYLVEIALDEGWKTGLTEIEAQIAAEEAAVNWTAPRPPKKKTK